MIWVPQLPSKTASAPGFRMRYTETLCRAAELTGATVNQFLVQAALKEAQEVIEREEVVRPQPTRLELAARFDGNPAKPNAS